MGNNNMKDIESYGFTKDEAFNSFTAKLYWKYNASIHIISGNYVVYVTEKGNVCSNVAHYVCFEIKQYPYKCYKELYRIFLNKHDINGIKKSDIKMNIKQHEEFRSLQLPVKESDRYELISTKENLE